MTYARQLRQETGVLKRSDYDPLDLRGRIELVNLVQHAGGPKSAIGEIMRNGQQVLVTNGHGFIGMNCLVRFDLEYRLKRRSPEVEILYGEDDVSYVKDDDLHPLKGNFVSTKVPFGFERRIEEGLSPEEYILYGRWRRSMRKSNRHPTLDEINQHYDPGRVGQVAFFMGDDESHQEVVLIRGWETIHVINYLGISELLPNPWERSRVVMADSKKGIRRLRKEIIGEELVPVRMEELRYS